MSQKDLPLLPQSLVFILAKKAIMRTSAITNISNRQARVFKNLLRLELPIFNLDILDLQMLKKIDKIAVTVDRLYELIQFSPIQHYPYIHMIQVGISIMPYLTIRHMTLMTLNC